MSIAEVSAVMGSYNSGANTTSLATAPFNCVAGNTISFGLIWASNTNLPNSITDTAGNTYIPDTRYWTGVFSLQYFYVQNCLGHATNVVTAQWPGNQAYVASHCRQISGLQTSSSKDVGNAGANGSSTGLTSATFTTDTNDEYIMAMAVGATYVNWTLGAGWNNLVEDNTPGYGKISASQSRIVSSIQTAQTAQMTQSVNGNWGIIVISFRGASSAPISKRILVPQAVRRAAFY